MAASATPLVLSILDEEESYGYAIPSRVRELSGGALEWSDRMLYPPLHRLQRLGYVTTEWRIPPHGRRRGSYAITRQGPAALGEHKRQWAVDDRDVDELVDHLRARIADLSAAGLADDEAFLVAVKRLGALDELSREFGREQGGRLWKQLVTCCGDEPQGTDSGWLTALVLAVLAAVTLLVVLLVAGYPDELPAWVLRNAGLLVPPFVAGYFAIRRRLRRGSSSMGTPTGRSQRATPITSM